MVWIGAGCGLDRVWIGLDPGLDRPRSGPTCLCMLQLGCSMTRKGRQGAQAASVQLGCLTAWQRGFSTVCCLAAWQGEELQSRKPKNHATITGPDINSPIHYIIPKVWIKSFRMVWIGGLDRVWDRGLIQTLHFEPQPCVIGGQVCFCFGM